MKTDRLEEFIASNREDFDNEEPSAFLWDRIEDDIKPKAKKIALPSFVWQAAAASVIFAIAWFGNDAYRNITTSKIEVAKVELSESEQALANDVKETLFYYSNKIDSKKEQLFTLTSNNPEITQEVNIELENLDKTLKELKNDLKDGADNQEVIEAVIQNYRLKLKILEEMLQILDTKNDNKKEDNNEYGQIKI